MATTNEIGKAIYSILSGNATVSGLVSTRIYPVVVPQDTSFPFVVFTITSEEPSHSKDGVSGLDVISFQVDCYGLEYDENTTLANAVRTALDFYKGTIGGQNVQRIRFQDVSDGEYDEDLGVFWKSLDFDARLKRER
tara:strand:+ start:1108 stop:1518 length:411 start_codon:yes stop_codon:yes gene_type:complete